MDNKRLDATPKASPTPISHLPEISNALRQRLARLKKGKRKKSLPDVKVLLQDFKCNDSTQLCYTKCKINLHRSTFCKILKQSSSTKYKPYELIYSGRHKILKARSEVYGSNRAIKSTVAVPMQMAPKNKEYLICRELDHPNIANVYEMFVQDLKLDIASEYLEGGELNEYLNSRNYDEIQAAKYIYQISSALIYLNNHNITHRDIKPQNILFENREPDSPLKLIDFDLCGKKHHERFHVKVGTLPFAAPEVLEGDYNRKCDIWSLGIVLYMMLHGIYPFTSSTSQELYDKIRRYEASDLKLAKFVLSDNAIDLLQKMLTKDPAARISAVEVFSHPWVRQVAPPIPDFETLHRLVKKLKSYSHTPTFQKIILYYATTQVLSYHTIKTATSLFISLDRDGDGYLSSKDLNTCMNHIGTDCNNAVCLLKSCSFNNRKYLTYSEFLTIMVDWSEVMTEGMACTIFNAVSLQKPALSKKKLLIFVNNLPIDEIWTEAFHYLVKPPTDKVISP